MVKPLVFYNVVVCVIYYYLFILVFYVFFTTAKVAVLQLIYAYSKIYKNDKDNCSVENKTDS